MFGAVEPAGWSEQDLPSERAPPADDVGSASIRNEPPVSAYMIKLLDAPQRSEQGSRPALEGAMPRAARLDGRLDDGPGSRSAFLAVPLREGFETCVFLLAAFQDAADTTAAGAGA